jgi:hypothetical protein
VAGLLTVPRQRPQVSLRVKVMELETVAVGLVTRVSACRKASCFGGRVSVVEGVSRWGEGRGYGILCVQARSTGLLAAAGFSPVRGSNRNRENARQRASRAFEMNRVLPPA